MDVLPKTLPEQFFLDVDTDCLAKLAAVVNFGTACTFRDYIDSPNHNPTVAKIIEDNLGDAIKRATFHQELHDKGIVKALRSINLGAIAAMHNVDEMQKLVDIIEYVRANSKYVRATIHPVTKDEYTLFYVSVPDVYKDAIRINRDYFYDSRGRDFSTGLGIIVRRQQEIDIAYKGLKYRIAMLKKYSDPTPYYTRM